MDNSDFLVLFQIEIIYLSSGFESREVDDISVDTSSSSIKMSDLQSQPDMWIGCAEPLESLLGADIMAIAYDITNR